MVGDDTEWSDVGVLNFESFQMEEWLVRELWAFEGGFWWSYISLRWRWWRRFIPSSTMIISIRGAWIFMLSRWLQLNLNGGWCWW